MTRKRALPGAGFTLIEVMIALSILAVALVGLIGRTAENIRITREMGMLDVATDLARAKMYDIEAEILKDGFPELDKELDGDFADEGWPRIEWEAKIEKVELPNLNTLESLQNGEGGEGGEGGDEGGGLLGGGLLGGAGGEDGGSLAGASFIAGQFELVSQVLEVSIRKVTLKVKWTVGQEQKDMVVACYFTDANAMGRVIGGLGAGMPNAGNGAGDGSGSGGSLGGQGGGFGGQGGGFGGGRGNLNQGAKQ